VKSVTGWTSGSVQVARQIGSAIVDGTYRVSERLPLEAELSSQYGVSRNTIREAVRLLAAKMLVEVAPRRGTVVLPRTQWNILDREVLEWSASVFRNDPTFMREISRARYIVEPAAAEEAARHATPAEIETIREAYRAMVAEAGQPHGDPAIKADLAFHFAIASATHNRFLKFMAHSIIHAIGLNFQVLFTIPDNFANNLENHRLTAEAIAAHDPPAAARAMLRLLDHSEDAMRTLFETTWKDRA
jgi:DNA-binding FadR family transcriptional regulator